MSRDVIAVTGPEAGTYLQGQLSQDVLGLEIGASAPTLLLEPTGKLGFWFGVTRTADEAFELEVDEGYGEAVVARLQRFKIRTAAEIVPVTSGGEDAGSADHDQIEVDRIAAGIPKMGAEITEGVIPAELGQAVIDGSVSFTKGCFTGQELVARIDSRGGNVPRHLRSLVFSGDEAFTVGDEIVVDGKVVGTVTSSAYSPGTGTSIGLGFVHRSVEPPANAIVRRSDAGSGEAGELAVEIRALPLVELPTGFGDGQPPT